MRDRIEVITECADLERLQPEWDALYERSPPATPFQQPSWLIGWWHCFSPGSLHVICVRRAGKLIGCAPFYAETTAAGRPRMLPLGIGVSDYLDVLIAPEAFVEVDRLLGDHIAARRDELGSWELCELRPESAAMSLSVPTGMIEQRAECSTCPVLAIPSGASDLKQVLPAHRLQALRTGWRRARAFGNLRIEQASIESARESLAMLDELHRKRWRSEGAPGVTADRRVHDLLMRSVPDWIASGRCILLVMFCDQIPVAAHLLLRGRKELLSYMTGYDPEFSRLGAGALLLGDAIERARRTGEQFHFLRGEERYKYLWGARPRSNWRRLFTSREPQ
nr:GNAT family N-acetyltransferase [uncultured Steroidobacter sp.]